MCKCNKEESKFVFANDSSDGYYFFLSVVRCAEHHVFGLQIDGFLLNIDEMLRLYQEMVNKRYAIMFCSYN